MKNFLTIVVLLVSFLNGADPEKLWVSEKFVALQTPKLREVPRRRWRCCDRFMEFLLGRDHPQIEVVYRTRVITLFAEDAIEAQRLNLKELKYILSSYPSLKTLTITDFEGTWDEVKELRLNNSDLTSYLIKSPKKAKGRYSQWTVKGVGSGRRLNEPDIGLASHTRDELLKVIRDMQQQARKNKKKE